MNTKNEFSAHKFEVHIGSGMSSKLYIFSFERIATKKLGIYKIADAKPSLTASKNRKCNARLYSDRLEKYLKIIIINLVK